MKSKRASSRPAAAPWPPPPLEFKAFIAYADRDAAREAMRTIGQVLRASGQPYQLHPMLWRFDQLCHERWHTLALRDATEAHVAVLASTTAGALSPAHEMWISEFLGWKRGARTTLIALLGPEDAWTITIDQPEAKPPATLAVAPPAARAA